MFKSFVTESEIEDGKKKKQEEWEQTRTEDQPMVRPEEKVDNRTLYERLKTNADKKQEEHDEKYSLKNMIYQGLDDEEFEHIEKVKQEEYDATVKRLQEEGDQIKTFRDAQAVRTAEDEKVASIKVGGRLGKARVGTQKKTSQLQMMSGMIKKKRKKVDDDAAAATGGGSGGGGAAAAAAGAGAGAGSDSTSKKAKTTAEAGKQAAGANGDGSSDDSDDGGGGGLVGYGDSDDSD